MLKNKILSALGSGDKPLYVDDVFSTYLYDGNGTPRTITNGIDLAGKGGMVWIKQRSDSSYNHGIFDTVRGAKNVLASNSTAATGVLNDGLTSFSNNGFSVGNGGVVNGSGAYASWTFRKAPKFFDVVTYTGSGGAGQHIPHSLGVAPGMVIIKRTNGVTDWAVYHRSIGPARYTQFNLANSSVPDTTVWRNTAPTDTMFTVGSSALTNDIGATFVAYLFAHDDSAEGIVQCGTVTQGGVVNLGWEPQYVLYKLYNTIGDWIMCDSLRGLGPVGVEKMILKANLTTAETKLTSYTDITSTGFSLSGFSDGDTVAYLAIRRSNKPPTVGTDVFMPTVYTGTNTNNRFLNTGILTDMVWLRSRDRSGAGYEGFLVGDRLRGNAFLKTQTTAAEVTAANGLDAQLVASKEYGNAFSSNTGIYIGNHSGDEVGGANINARTTASGHVALAFKRAVGVFDSLVITGTGAAITVPHGLGVVPELMICRVFTSYGSFRVYHKAVSHTAALNLYDNNVPVVSASHWNNTAPTDEAITLGMDLSDNEKLTVAHLFASKPGISKVFSFTGNGTNQNIECGFTTGARFLLLKRTDSTGNWLVVDTARGLVSGNDPTLASNSTEEEATTIDWIDPYAGGFNIVQETTNNANVNGATYIGLAIA